MLCYLLQMKWNDWCFSPRFCTVRLNWAGDNLGEWHEFCYEPCPWYRIDRSTCWPAVQRATTVPRMPPRVICCKYNQILWWANSRTPNMCNGIFSERYPNVLRTTSLRTHCSVWVGSLAYETGRACWLAKTEVWLICIFGTHCSFAYSEDTPKRSVPKTTWTNNGETYLYPHT